MFLPCSRDIVCRRPAEIERQRINVRAGLLGLVVLSDFGVAIAEALLRKEL